MRDSRSRTALVSVTSWGSWQMGSSEGWPPGGQEERAGLFQKASGLLATCSCRKETNSHITQLLLEPRKVWE